ncbi:putative N-acetyltransferase san isoform X2 [Oratosquilla oratoria]|uniref:putative N-acetyltransferase san isoform X2 n=1 Tax=Oratosquilla oratoria TaxID=337810 RepID=UPI003F7695D1
MRWSWRTDIRENHLPAAHLQSLTTPSHPSGAYYNDIVVGAVCCRVNVTDGQRKLYIMTLGCLAPYRRLGIGTKMLQHVLNYVEKDGNFHSIFLHVQVNNDGALEFYRKFGFEVVETKQCYYKRIEPADAHVLQKTLVKS